MISRKMSARVPSIILTIFIGIYILYFSLFTIFRYQKMYAHYFDLGIMNQTVYNSYMAMKTGDMSRLLELTNPHDSSLQVKRMSIHNDITLFLLAPLYFIHSGPETLLAVQTITIAIGAIFIFKISQFVFKDAKKRDWIALLLSFGYLMYPPLQKANAFDFHAITMATTFILGMYYFWIKRKFNSSLIFAILAILTKEEVGLTIAFFGFIVIYQKIWQNRKFLAFPNFLTKKNLEFLKKILSEKEIYFSLILLILGLLWSYISVKFIIPSARGGEHFATKYYEDIFRSPISIFLEIFNQKTLTYVWRLLGPVGFIPILSPVLLVLVLPEFLINVLSSNESMINTYFHYDSVITPLIFLATIYGLKRIIEAKYKIGQYKIGLYILTTIVLFSIFYSTLPYSLQKDTFPWKVTPIFVQDLIPWKQYFDKDQLKLSTTGRIAPHFTNRQYFYDFASEKYELADYVIIDIWDKDHGFLKDKTIPAYAKLVHDWRFVRIFENNGIEVFKKIN